MKSYFLSRLQDESASPTIETILMIVCFVVFGLVAVGMITNAAGQKSADISNCIAQSGNIITGTHTGAAGSGSFDPHKATAAGVCDRTDKQTYQWGEKSK